VPVVGRHAGGLAAALVALFAAGPVTSLLVIAAILVVPQVEGNILQPYVVGRSVDVHPLAILLGLTAGSVLAGIIGAIVASPAVAVGAAVLRYLREDGAPAAGGPDTEPERPPASVAASAPADG
jgi:predicted PurR-regulated permease PerM